MKKLLIYAAADYRGRCEILKGVDASDFRPEDDRNDFIVYKNDVVMILIAKKDAALVNGQKSESFNIDAFKETRRKRPSTLFLFI